MNLLQVLLELRKQHGYLPEAELLALCEEQHVPKAKIEELCSFYPHLQRTKPARHRVAGCRDLACYMRDGSAALESLEDACGANSEIEFEDVSCLGRCDDAPACTVDDVPMDAQSALAAIKSLATNSTIVPTNAAVIIEAMDEAADEATGNTIADERRYDVDPYDDQSERFGVFRSLLDDTEAASRIVDSVTTSGLRGMGGAGFPTGRKWSLVANQDATPRYIICNADESEPGTFKDRVLLRDLPHLMIEGMLLAGLAIKSHEAWVYIRHEYVPELESLRAAIDEAHSLGVLGKNILGSGFDFDIQVFVSPGGYILGEETALLEALEGRRGEPRNKPPYPGVEGLHGKPTLINNVETFALVPHAIKTGTSDRKFFSVSGDVAQPGVFEVSVGTTLRELVELAGGMHDGAELLAFLPGGASTGFLSAEHANIPMTFDALQGVGSALGSGAVVVVKEGRDLVELAGNLTTFFRNESCGKCVPCRVGTERAVKLVESHDDASLQAIPALHEVLRETSICGLGQAALNPLVSVLDNFPVRVQRGDPKA